MPVDPNHRYADEGAPKHHDRGRMALRLLDALGRISTRPAGRMLVQDRWTEDGRKRMVEVQRNPEARGVLRAHAGAGR